MKLSCLPVSLFENYAALPFGAADWAQQAQTLGLDGFDISVLLVKNRTPAYLQELSCRLHGLCVKPVMMTAYPDFTAPDPLQRRRERDYFVSDIALASQLGFQYLRVTPGQLYGGMDMRDGVSLVCDAFFAMDEIAKAYGVTLLFENHTKPNAWTRFDFSCDPLVFLEICRNIRGSGIGVVFDTGNAASCGREPLELLDRVYHMVRAVHITDTGKFGEYSPCPIGSGAAPNAEILRELSLRGFDGWVSVEEESGSSPEDVRLACQYVRRLLRLTGIEPAPVLTGRNATIRRQTP